MFIEIFLLVAGTVAVLGTGILATETDIKVGKKIRFLLAFVGFIFTMLVTMMLIISINRIQELNDKVNSKGCPEFVPVQITQDTLYKKIK